MQNYMHVPALKESFKLFSDLAEEAVEGEGLEKDLGKLVYHQKLLI